MRTQLTRLTPTTVFAALASRPVGCQILTILGGWGHKTEHLRGPMPFINEDSVIFIGTDFMRFPSRYLRLLPVSGREDRMVDEQMRTIATQMGLMRKRGVRIIFVNERHVGRSGEFEGRHLENFTHALVQMCGRQKIGSMRITSHPHTDTNLSAAEKRVLGITATRSARCEDWC